MKPVRQVKRRAMVAMVLAMAACLALPSAQASCLDAGAPLGQSAQQLEALLAQAERVRHPVVLSGAAGRWKIHHVVLAGLSFQETLFFNAEGLQRIQWDLAPEAAQQADSAFDTLVKACRAELGTELSAHDDLPQARNETASWASEHVDIVVARSQSDTSTRVHMIQKLRQLKDASEL